MVQNHEARCERFFEALINGERPAARTIVTQCVQAGMTPEQIIIDLFWPTYETIERLWRADQLTSLSYHLSTRLLRVLVDQSAQRLRLANGTQGRRVFACCGPSESEELAAQMAVDLLEDAGFRVTFAGGGIPADEILAFTQENRPEVLLMFASAAQDLPAIRKVIDTLREIGACRSTQVVVGGGVFNRAEGVAEEIGADLWACDPLELIELIKTEPERRARSDQRTVGKVKKRNAA